MFHTEITDESTVSTEREIPGADASWLFPLSFLLLIPVHLLGLCFSVAAAGYLVYKYVL